MILLLIMKNYKLEFISHMNYIRFDELLFLLLIFYDLF